MRASLALLLFVLVASHSAGQDKPLDRIAFEVASVRVNTTGSDSSTFRSTGSGGIVFTNSSLRDIIVRAYEIPFTLRQYLLVGGPSSVLVQRFDVQAVPPAGASSEHLPLMLQALLMDRFGFRAHRESRSIPAYAVMLAREGQLGPALRAADFSCQDYFGTGKSPKVGSDKSPWCTPSPVAGAFHLRGASTISSMLRSFQAFTDRPLVDETRLVGNFEWEMEFTDSPDAATATRVGFPTALREQLGLRMQAANMPVEVLVIDSVTMPTAN